MSSVYATVQNLLQHELGIPLKREVQIRSVLYFFWCFGTRTVQSLTSKWTRYPSKGKLNYVFLFLLMLWYSMFTFHEYVKQNIGEKVDEKKEKNFITCWFNETDVTRKVNIRHTEMLFAKKYSAERNSFAKKACAIFFLFLPASGFLQSCYFYFSKACILTNGSLRNICRKEQDFRYSDI